MTTHNRLQKVPALRLWVAGTLFSHQLVSAQSGSKCTVYGTPQVRPALVSLENGTAASVYKRGKPIHVTLTLRAGAEGVYLPDFFRAFQETCSHGFAAEVLTLPGKIANPTVQGCAYAGGTPKIAFIALEPGETRTWSTDLATASIAPGHYCLHAEYLSSEDVVGWATNLPADRALVAKGRITAKPIPVEIRQVSTPKLRR